MSGYENSESGGEWCPAWGAFRAWTGEAQLDLQKMTPRAQLCKDLSVLKEELPGEVGGGLV